MNTLAEKISPSTEKICKKGVEDVEKVQYDILTSKISALMANNSMT